MKEQDKIDFYRSGLTKFTEQDFAGAVKDFSRALEIDPHFADVLQAMAHVLEKLEDYDTALTFAKQAVEHNSKDFLTHTTLSIIYQRKGMIPEAEREKARAAELQSDRIQ